MASSAGTCSRCAHDGRPVNGHFWVFYGSLTDVEFRITITDRLTGAFRHFDNPPLHMASAGHTDAFPAGE